MLRISAIITASGMAERFGSDKLMYMVNSKPVIHYVMENVANAQFYERLIVLRNMKLKKYAEYHRACRYSIYQESGDSLSTFNKVIY